LFVALGTAIVLCGVLAAGAGAVVVRGAAGQIFGVTPAQGVRPGSLPGALTASPRRSADGTPPAGSLEYHGGPVLHASAPYIVYWDPTGGPNPIPWRTKSLITRYFTDLAADSGMATNVFAVARQYTDTTGFADYRQVFNPATQVINDTQPYPSAGQCAEVNATATQCVTDTQIQNELERLITSQSLPKGLSGTPPIYFVVLPSYVNECITFGGATECSDGSASNFCAYHSFSPTADALYAAIPTLPLLTGPKGCQVDGNTLVQEPNGDGADVVIKYLSHEFNETITDPQYGTGWWDNGSGNEDGDNCNFYSAAFDPLNGSNPDAFKPTLGAPADTSPGAGNLYNQLINGHQYYTQSEWSNSDFNCEMQPTASAIGASFTGPKSALPATAVSFDPGASSSAAPYSSVSWNFGDGGTAFSATADALLLAQHTYAAAGTYTVSLTLVDQYGNLSTASHNVFIYSTPVPSLQVSGPTPFPGTSLTFNATGSSDADFGIPITSYSWSFGDGSGGSGATARHAYRASGIYTVGLTVTNSLGLASSTTHQVTIGALPTAAFTFPRATAADVAVGFSGSRSNDPGGSITSYRWSFGDHHSGLGRSVKHTYSRAGRYTVTLTVRASSGRTATVSHRITVGAAPISRLAVRRNGQGTFLLVSVSGPGVLSVGSTRTRFHRAGSLTTKVSPSRAGRAALHRQHNLTVKVKVRFVTRAGVTSSKTVSITFLG
jgi:PKD repeat protein